MKLIKLFCVATLMLFTTMAYADNGSTVIDEFGCAIVPADSGLPITLYSTDTHFVVNNKGNVNMWCDFVFDTALCEDSKAMQSKGFSCGTLAGPATKTHAQTSCEYGVVHLSCQVKAE